MEPLAVKLQSAVSALRELGARRVLLFGSYAYDPEHARDLDLAVEGIPLERLGMAGLECYRLLRVPLDLVSREESPAFFNLIAQDAVTLYEQR
jgi:predicted nucleotidyltransferase